MRASGRKQGQARRFAVAAAMLVLLPFAADAQQRDDPYLTPPGARTNEQKKTDAEIDKAYQQTVKGTRDSRPANKTDPWGTLRPAASDNSK